MKLALSLFLLPLLVTGGIIQSLPKNNEGEIHAVIVVGSNGWNNYRHQADGCHAYHTLVNHGVKKENIITMMYDDIANNEENPYPGKIFNKPNGTDVYEGCNIDYRGEDVTSANFMAILAGDSETTKGKPVLKSTEKDNVFIYFSDHGGVGILCMIDGDLVSAKQFNDVFDKMHSKRSYKELVFYVEACESASIFETLDKKLKDYNMYVVTASDDSHSSFAAYCITDFLPDNCMGDQFSVSWMEDSDSVDLNQQTLEEQWKIAKRLTINSTVCHFGDLDIAKQPVANFQGHKKPAELSSSATEDFEHYESWPVVEIPLRILESKLMRSEEKDRPELIAQIKLLKEKRELLAEDIHAFVRKLNLLEDEENLVLFEKQLVKDLDCHHEVFHEFHQNCYNFATNPYVATHSFILNNLCNSRIPTSKILEVMKEHCQQTPVQDVY